MLGEKTCGCAEMDLRLTDEFNFPPMRMLRRLMLLQRYGQLDIFVLARPFMMYYFQITSRDSSHSTVQELQLVLFLTV